MRGIALQRVAPRQAWGLTPAWRPQADDHGYSPEGWVQTALPRGYPLGKRGSVAGRPRRGGPGGTVICYDFLIQ